MVPVKIVVERLSNNKVTDLLGIKRIDLNKKKLAFGSFALRIRKTQSLLMTEIYTSYNLKHCPLGTLQRVLKI